jgi:hypothetical protein
MSATLSGLPFGDDIYTEPDADTDTLANLGPLRALAGTWISDGGLDEHPVLGGPERDAYVEHYELQPIDPQTNGPQLLYGLRYHTHIVKPGEVETFHDQVGYWLWDPRLEVVTLTLAIPRAQVALATGPATADATEFEVVAERGSTNNGIASGAYLEAAFTTVHFRMRVTVHADGRWSYEQDTLLQTPDRTEVFHHTDRNTLRRVAAPEPNPLARASE